MATFFALGIVVAFTILVIATGWAVGGGIFGLIRKTGFWYGFRTSFFGGILFAVAALVGIAILGVLFMFFVNLFFG